MYQQPPPPTLALSRTIMCFYVRIGYSELVIRSTFGPIACSFYGEAQRREIYASLLYLAQRERISCCSTAVTGRR